MTRGTSETPGEPTRSGSPDLREAADPDLRDLRNAAFASGTHDQFCKLNMLIGHLASCDFCHHGGDPRECAETNLYREWNDGIIGVMESPPIGAAVQDAREQVPQRPLSDDDFKLLTNAAILPPYEADYLLSPWQRVKKAYESLGHGVGAPPVPAALEIHIRKPRIPPGEAPWVGPDGFDRAIAALPALLANLHDLLGDEDLDEAKLEEASGNLLPRLADALTPLVPRMKIVSGGSAHAAAPAGHWEATNFSSGRPDWNVVDFSGEGDGQRRWTSVHIATQAEAEAVRDALNRVASGVPEHGAPL